MSDQIVLRNSNNNNSNTLDSSNHKNNNNNSNLLQITCEEKNSSYNGAAMKLLCHEEPLNKEILIESNLCHQVSLIVLNTLSLILIHQQEKLCQNHGDNPIVKQLVDIYFYLLESNQSLSIKLKTFAALRIIIKQVPCIFLEGNSSTCANVCLKLLRMFQSSLAELREQSCIVLYLLMRKNYELTKHKSISRVHSQIIISTSQLIGNMKLTNSSEVFECLALLDQMACVHDRVYQSTRLALDVQDLTKRIRNILMATCKMKTFQTDTEMLVDSQ